MKKTLLTMGTLVSIGAPIATVVACGDKTQLQPTIYNENTRVELVEAKSFCNALQSSEYHFQGAMSFDLKNELKNYKDINNSGRETHEFPKLKDIETIRREDYRAKFQVEWVSGFKPENVTEKTWEANYHYGTGNNRTTFHILENNFKQIIANNKDMHSFEVNVHRYLISNGTHSKWLMTYSEVQRIFNEAQKVLMRSPRPNMNMTLVGRIGKEKEISTQTSFEYYDYYVSSRTLINGYEDARMSSGNAHVVSTTFVHVPMKSKKDVTEKSFVWNMLMDKTDGALVLPDKNSLSPWTMVGANLLKNNDYSTSLYFISDADLSKILS